jgi:hypothetical protein
MKNRSLREYSDIADIHALRLKEALNEVTQLLPFTAQSFSEFTAQEVAFLDMLTTRFSKLQDVIGTKIFPLILQSLQEEAVTFIDKLNRLEKLNYISDVNWWIDLKEIRNQITHDYPSDYIVLCEHFQAFVPKAGELLLFWEGLKEKIKII